MESGFRGETIGPDPGNGVASSLSPESDEQNPFAGLGPILEDDDQKVYRQTDALVLRQELLALNHLAQDTHYGYVVGGYPWSTLTHDTTRDVWSQTLPYGVSAVSVQAVPNKNLDLVNKSSETLLQDFPQAEAEPIDDTEDAEAAADMANRILEEDASENGTNDAVLWDDRVKRSLHCATAYLEGWIDQTGGGYVPLQIKAHPLAVSPMRPLVGPDGAPPPGNAYEMRYVTGPISPEGEPTEQSQFTKNPSEAAPQWQAKFRGAKWNREHLRVYPETARVEDAEQIIILGYCTVSEGKRRWKDVAAMDDAQVNVLCDWMPTRALVLLPPFLRARYSTQAGRDKEKMGDAEQRIMFYYHRFIRACPDYPKGADVVCTGAKGGLVLHRDVLSVEVKGKEGTETRCLQIPVVQITPRQDPMGQDPSGRAYIELFVGAVEHNAHLALSYATAISKAVTNPYVIPATSTLEGAQIEDARSSGDMLPIVTFQDVPSQIPPPVLPPSFFNMYELSDNAIESIANQTKAANGEIEGSKDPSGKAIQLTVAANNVNHSSMLNAVNTAYARWCRIKLDLMMRGYTTTQQIRYVGDDGAFKQDDFTGVDFALVGKVKIRAGTGTMMTPDAKVQYLSNLTAGMLLPPEEAQEAARPAFSKRLGLPPNPHEQYIERCIDCWLDGPPPVEQTTPPQIDPLTQQPVPAPSWDQQWQAWQAEQQQIQAQMAPAIQAAAAMGQPTPPMPPGQLPKPFTAFPDKLNDTEPLIAAMWLRKLSRTMSTVKYDDFRITHPGWVQDFDMKYTKVRQAQAMAAQAAQPQPQGKPGDAKPQDEEAPKPGLKAA